MNDVRHKRSLGNALTLILLLSCAAGYGQTHFYIDQTNGHNTAGAAGTSGDNLKSVTRAWVSRARTRAVIARRLGPRYDYTVQQEKENRP